MHYLKSLIITPIILVLVVFFLSMQRASSQNYVVSGGEVFVVSNLDLSTSAVWKTDKSVNPGFFTWSSGSENYTGTSDLHHVNGYVKKVGNQGFVFPVGDGVDLRSLQMSAPQSSNSEYAVAWLSGDPGSTADPTDANQFHPVAATSGVIKAVSQVGQWDWLPVNGTGEGLLITVSIPSLTGPFFTSASDVRLVGWNGISWVNLGSNGATGLSENSSLSGTMIAGIKAIGIGSIKSVVSVVEAPVFAVVQNADGTLTVTGTATGSSTVAITFPDKSVITVSVDSQGAFGPVTSLLPQVLKNVVKAVAVNSVGQSSTEVFVPYETKQNVFVSEAITPDGDGINDTWKIVDIEKFPNTTVRVFNRWGHLVFSAFNYKNDWAGNYKDFNSILPQSSSYYYQIDYGTDGSIDKEGWIYIRK